MTPDRDLIALNASLGVVDRPATNLEGHDAQHVIRPAGRVANGDDLLWKAVRLHVLKDFLWGYRDEIRKANVIDGRPLGQMILGPPKRVPAQDRRDLLALGSHAQIIADPGPACAVGAP